MSGSPEPNVLKVSFCGGPMSVFRRASSVVRRQHLPCGHSRGHIFCSIDLKFGQNVCLAKISNELEFRSKTRSLGQFKEILCGRSRGHISCSLDLKIGQNICLDKISNAFKFGSPCVKK